MKKLSFLLLICLTTIFFAGCGSDNNVELSTPETQEGLSVLYGSITSGEEGLFVLAEPSLNGVTSKVSNFETSYNGAASNNIYYGITDSEGNYSIKDIPAGEYFVQVQEDGISVGCETRVLTSPNKATILNINVTPTGSISGNVLLSGETDHSGIIVYADGTSYLGVTDTSGNYTISNIPAGSYVIKNIKSEFTGTTLSATVTGGQITTLTSQSMTKKVYTGNIYGKVIDSNGSPVDLASVSIYLKGTLLDTVLTDSNGDYSFPGFNSGTYKLEASKTGLNLSYIPSIVLGNQGTDITAPNLVLTSTPVVTGQATGVVRDQDGNPVPSATVTILENTNVVSTVTTNATGTYSFASLKEGYYIIKASLNGLEVFQFVKIIAGSSETVPDFELRLNPGTGMVFGYIRNQFSWVDNCTVEIWTNGTLDQTIYSASNGYYEFSNIEFGTHEIKYLFNNGVEQRGIETTKGVEYIPEIFKYADVTSLSVSPAVIYGTITRGAKLKDAKYIAEYSDGFTKEVLVGDYRLHIDNPDTNSNIILPDGILQKNVPEHNTVNLTLDYEDRGVIVSSSLSVVFDWGVDYEYLVSGAINETALLNKGGKITLIYNDNGAGEIYSAIERPDTYEINTIDSGGVGLYLSGALDPTSAYGDYGISYYDYTNQVLKYANYNGSWNVTTVDGTPDVGKYSDLNYMSGGTVEIVYYDTANNLKYAGYNGASWNTSYLDTPPVGFSIDSKLSFIPGLGIRSSVVFYNVVDTMLYKSDFSMDMWGYGSVEVATGTSVFTTEFYTMGWILVNYHQSSGELRFNNHYDVTSVVETGNTITDLDMFLFDNNIYLAYYDSTSSLLKYAVSSDEGATWTVNNIPGYTAIENLSISVVERNYLDCPVISFYDTTDSKIKMIRF